MTPEQYRAKWGLPADYSMVAPNYAEARPELAKTIGLGQPRKNDEGSAEAPEAATSTKGRRTRKAAESIVPLRG
ncbi:MucR family transcriptional regulator [Microvirga sp. BT689]|nr:MucR family transcriptional regulator [Microvirga arvi]